jgi:hypothetical protein
LAHVPGGSLLSKLTATGKTGTFELIDKVNQRE